MIVYLAFFLAALPPFPQEKTGKQVFELRFCSFPVGSLPDNECQWMTLGYPRIFVCPLDSLSAFYTCHDAHARPYSTDRRRYTQQPLHRAAFIRTCSYTKRFVHREAFTHRCLHTQMHLRKEAFTHRSGLFGRTCTVAV